LKQNEKIDGLITQAAQAMERDGYKPGYIEKLSHVWKRLKEYLSDNDLPFGKDSSWRFLTDEYGIRQGNDFAHLKPVNKRRRRAIHILLNCEEDGRITHEKSYLPYAFNEPFATVFDQFLKERKAGRPSLVTVNRDIYTLNHLSKYLQETDIKSIDSINTSIIIGFLKWLSSSKGLPTMKNVTASIRLLLKYLHINSCLEKDFSAFLQPVRVRKTIPSIYSTAEINEMLESFNRASAVGTRNYAMVLANLWFDAARLGMRASDICALKFDEIHWDRNTIEFVTKKTGKYSVLPLPADVGNAIIKYLKYARPNVEDDHVFLRMETPHGVLKPASLYMIVTRAFRNTGIITNPGRRHGPHALRASLATAMLNENVPLPVISETLSHSSTDTTRIYLKVDIPNLRRLALEVPGLDGIWMGGARYE